MPSVLVSGMKKRNRKRKRGDAMLVTLCSTCVSQYCNSGAHIVRRANPRQAVKDTCCYCGCRLGWDYKIKRRRK